MLGVLQADNFVYYDVKDTKFWSVSRTAQEEVSLNI
jgi:hypothetical protein